MSAVGTCPHCGARAVLLSGHDICRECFDYHIPSLVDDYSQVAWAAVAFVNDPYGFTGQDYDTPSTWDALVEAVRDYEKRWDDEA